MNPLLFISSLPFLDLLDNLIVLAAEFVAIFCLDESAHSQFWFMFLLGHAADHRDHRRDRPVHAV